MADSRLCKLSLQLIFVTLSWSTTIAIFFLELAEEDCIGLAYVFHPCDVSSPANLLPFDAKDGAQAALVKPPQQPDLLPIRNIGLCTVQEDGNDDSPVYLDLSGEAERVTLPHSL